MVNRGRILFTAAVGSRTPDRAIKGEFDHQFVRDDDLRNCVRSSNLRTNAVLFPFVIGVACLIIEPPGGIRMPYYWTLKSMPELAPFDAPTRRRIWRRHAWKAFLHFSTWAYLGGIFAVLAVTWETPILLFEKISPSSLRILFFYHLGLAGLLSVAWGQHLTALARHHIKIDVDQSVDSVDGSKLQTLR